MRTTLIALAVLILAPFATRAAQSPIPDRHRIFFLHHSTGRNLIAEGEVRIQLERIEKALGVDLRFWDHDYNYEGLTDPDGILHPDWNFGIPYDNTDPYGLNLLWAGDGSDAKAARDSILSRFDVIAFKSCYTASEIPTDEQLESYKTWYLEIRDVLDRHPGKIFLIVSPPPRHRLATPYDLTAEERLSQADRARAFADWLGSPEFLEGHPNLRFFDLFDHLAAPDDGGPVRNLLRAEYERDPDDGDSHPNALANEQVGPLFAAALAAAARAPVPAPTMTLGGFKSLFR